LLYQSTALKHWKRSRALVDKQSSSTRNPIFSKGAALLQALNNYAVV
jgi:hypothetical protein